MKPVAALLITLFLTACVSPAPIGPRPDSARQFTLADGSALTVTSNGREAQLRYPARYRLTDAETASYVEDATGCTPGRGLGSSSDGYDAFITYALNCG